MATTTTTTKKQQAKTTKDSATVAKAAGVNIETALGGLSAANLKINRTFADMQEELIAKHAELAAVSESIALKKEEMERLHGADAILLTIDELRVKQQEFIAEQGKAQAALREQYAQLQRDAEQTRLREQNEYAYNTQQARKADADVWTEQKRVRGVQEMVRTEAFEKDIMARHAELAAKEQEYTAALDKEKTFETRLQVETDRAVNIVANTMKRDATHEKAMADVQHAAQVAGMQKDIEHKDDTIVALQRDMTGLKAQLAEAIAAQTSLAKATVDAASNKTAQAEALTLMTNLGGGNGARVGKS
jgi:hypothetical protein